MDKAKYWQRNQSWPYFIDRDCFLIPASRSDYRTLRKHLALSQAYDAEIRFVPARRLPDLSKRSAIAVEMPPKPIHQSIANCLQDKICDSLKEWTKQSDKYKVKFSPGRQGIAVFFSVC